MGSVDLLLDTNILIRIWRGDNDLRDDLSSTRCGLETIAYMEFVQGVNRSQAERADKFIDQFEFVPFTPAVSFRAVRLIRAFAPSKGLRMADAVIAATSLELEIPLLTLNKKHFDFIDGIGLI